MAHFDVKELEKRKKEDLQKLANELGLSDSGTKEELAKRIAAVDAETPEEEETQQEEPQQPEVPGEAEQETPTPEVSETDTEKDSVKVTVIETYKDKQAQQTFRPGKEFVVTAERAEVLVAGSYRRGWRKKQTYADTRTKRNTVHNKTDYQITHLLEYGHASRNGGRVKPRVHIKPVEEKMVTELQERIEKAVQQ